MRVSASLVEGWRGELCHVAMTDENRRFYAYKVPSFHNWTGLATALRDQQISDFPLCDKSFGGVVKEPRSRYSTREEFAQLHNGDRVLFKYGRGEQPDERDFGRLNKSRLDKK